MISVDEPGILIEETAPLFAWTTQTFLYISDTYNTPAELIANFEGEIVVANPVAYKVLVPPVGSIFTILLLAKSAA